MAPETAEPVDGPSIPQRIAQVCIYLSVVSVVVTIIGLVGIAMDTRPYGRMLLTLGIVGASVALVVTAAASAVDERVRGKGVDEDEDPGQNPY